MELSVDCVDVAAYDREQRSNVICSKFLQETPPTEQHIGVQEELRNLLRFAVITGLPLIQAVDLECREHIGVTRDQPLRGVDSREDLELVKRLHSFEVFRVSFRFLHHLSLVSSYSELMLLHEAGRDQ